MAIYALGDLVPQIDPTAFVHPDATVIGDVIIGPDSTIWPQAVLRGDYGRITVGARTSIQDGSVIHATLINPTFAGLAPGYAGLYQVVVQIPAGTRAGTYTLEIVSRGAISKTVSLPVGPLGAGDQVPGGAEGGQVAPGVAELLQRFTVSA